MGAPRDPKSMPVTRLEDPACGNPSLVGNPDDQVAREIQDMQQVVGRLLQVGVSLAAIVVLVGAAFYLGRHSEQVPNYHQFRGQSASFRSVPQIVANGFVNGHHIIQLGLVILIATPIARVLFSVFTFAKEKDRLYTLFTLIVLALLGYSFLATH